MNSTVAAVPVVPGVNMRDPGIVEVRHIDCSVRADRTMDWAKPLVAGLEGVVLFYRGESAAPRLHPQGMDLVAEGIWPYQATFETRDGTTAVAEPLVDKADFFSLDRHAEEMPEGIGVGMRAVFTEAFLIESTLDEVDGLLSAVGS